MPFPRIFLESVTFGKSSVVDVDMAFWESSSAARTGSL